MATQLFAEMIIYVGVDGSFELQRKGVVTVLLDQILESQPISAGMSTFNWANGWHWTVVMYFFCSNLVCPVVSHDDWGIQYSPGPSTLKKWVKHEIPRLLDPLPTSLWRTVFSCSMV